MVRYDFRSLLSFLVLFFFVLTPLAGCSSSPEPSADAIDGSKKSVVLMSVRGIGVPKDELNIYRGAIAEGLSNNYKVYTGQKVDQVVKKVFSHEAKKSTGVCDTTKCLRRIAIEFNSSLVAVSTVLVKKKEGFFSDSEEHLLAIEVKNIETNEIEYSKSDTCKKCDSGDVVAMLKEISGAEEEGGISLWTILGGVAVVGALAAASGSGGGGGGSSSGGGGTTTGTISYTWQRG